MELYEKSQVSKVMKELRLGAKLTQEELAKKMKCSRDAIAKIERGGHKPSYELFCRWIRACGKRLLVRQETKKKTKIL